MPSIRLRYRSNGARERVSIDVCVGENMTCSFWANEHAHASVFVDMTGDKLHLFLHEEFNRHVPLSTQFVNTVATAGTDACTLRT